MSKQLRPPSPRLSSTATDATIQKVGTFSSMAESDGETTTSMTSSEGSPPSNIRDVSAPTKEKRVSRTSLSRPQGYSPAMRVSKTLTPSGISNIRQSGVVKPPFENNNAVNAATKRISGASKRSSGGWDTLAKKSTTLRNSSASVGSRGSRTSISKKNASSNKGSVTGNTGKGNPKDDLIVKLNKQVEMLQEKQKKSDANHQKTTQNLEAKLDDLRMADSILIDQLRGERNELKEELDKTNDRIQAIREENEDAMNKELAAKRDLEQQLAEANARISKLSEQAMEDHFGSGGGGGGSKIDMLRERRRAIEAQMSQGADIAKDKIQQPPAAKSTDSDLDAVMKNLKDELEASRQVIVQQKQQLRLIFESQDVSEKETKAPSSEDDGESEWKARFMEMQKRHLQLECDRAWSEFQLRNRITNDSLKFNRRLKHWKDEVQDLENKLETLETIRARVHGVEQNQEQQHQQVVPEVSPVNDSSGGTPERGWWGFRK